ncbi:MAG TPA: MBOAT family protein [Polyangia bacterium]|jgi:hypothetical protein
MIDFPLSLLALPFAVAAGVGYVTLGAAPSVARRRLGRGVLLAATWGAPLATRGPGPVQLVMGLLVGFLGIRMVALANRWSEARRLPSPGRLAALMLLPDPLLVARREPLRRPRLVVARGLLAAALCVALLLAGNRLRLWHWSRFGDDLLVFAEVAIGAAGLHDLIVGLAALGGKQVRGLQDRPHLSSSLTQFWGRRWNRLVQGNLDRGFFRPWARRRSFTRGTLVAFAASGVMHVIAVLDAGPLAVTLGPAAAVMGFFMLHAALVLAERRFGSALRAESRHLLWLSRARTMVLFALLSPLLLDPFAAVANVHGRSLTPPPAQTSGYKN